MFHDTEGKVDNSLGLTDEQIEKLKSRNQDIQKIVSKAKEQASNRVVEYVLTKIREAGNEQWTEYEIGYAIQKAIHQGLFYDPGDFVLERYINEILCKQCQTEDQLRMMWDARFRRLKISKE